MFDGSGSRGIQISNYNKKLSVAHLNVRSLVPKYNLIKSLILDNNIDIFAMTETWLTLNIPNSFVNIPGYSLVRRDRDGRGGGVAAYIRSSIRFQLLKSSCSIEQQFFTIDTGKNSVLLSEWFIGPLI